MLEEYFGSSSTLQRNERVKLAAMFWNIVGAGMLIGGVTETSCSGQITSSAWDEAGRHFGRAAEQVQTRAAAISEAWSAEFLSRDVQHQPLTLSLARRDRWVLFPLTQTVLWVHRWLGAVLGDCAFSISARHKLKNALMIMATIGPLALAGLLAAYDSTSRTRSVSVELARHRWKAVLTR